MQPQPQLALPFTPPLPSLSFVEGSFRNCGTCGEAKDALRALGAGYISSGSFSSVHDHPTDPDRVIKVTRADLGSDATLAACLAHPDNPHLPKVYGVVRLPTGGFIAEVERLERIDGDSFDDWAADWGMDYGTPDLDALPDCAMKDAIQALIDATNASDPRHIDWDDHDGNVMLRDDGTVVLTDLLYDTRMHGCECSECWSDDDADALPLAA